MFIENHYPRIFGIVSAALIAVTGVFTVGGCRPVDKPDTAGEIESERYYPILEEGHWGYMNRNGHLAIAPDFDKAWPFSGNRALVEIDEKFGYIDRNGDIVIPARYEDAWYFADDLAPVQIEGTWSYIDTTGAVVVKRVDDVATIATNSIVFETLDLDRVRVGNHYGFRNAAGQIIIDPEFDQAWHFSDGLARVQVDGKWGFIDRSGLRVIPPQFDVAWDFEYGLARIQIDDRFGYIDHEGEYVWAPTN